jgi:hypothetical protein
LSSRSSQVASAAARLNLRYVVEGDANSWPLTPKYIEKDLRGFAMGTAGANKDFKILDWFTGLDQCPAPQREQAKADADRADESPYVLVWMEHDVELVDRAKRGPASDVRQRIQRLLVRQCAAKSVHGSEWTPLEIVRSSSQSVLASRLCERNWKERRIRYCALAHSLNFSP